MKRSKVAQVDRAGLGAGRARPRRGRRRRAVPVALRAEDHGPRGVRVRVDARGRGHGGRLRQARHRRRSPGLADVRQGLSIASRWAGATRPITVDSPTTGAISGRAGSTPARSSSSTSALIRPSPGCTRPSTTSSRPRAAWSARTPFTRCPAGCSSPRLSNDRDHGGRTGAGRVLQRREVPDDPLDADGDDRQRRQGREGGRRLRLRRARAGPQERHADLVLHRAGPTT